MISVLGRAELTASSVAGAPPSRSSTSSSGSRPRPASSTAALLLSSSGRLRLTSTTRSTELPGAQRGATGLDGERDRVLVITGNPVLGAYPNTAGMCRCDAT